METIIDESRLKQVFKEASIEALEDIAMIRAIQEGESSESVGREEIVKILEG